MKSVFEFINIHSKKSLKLSIILAVFSTFFILSAKNTYAASCSIQIEEFSNGNIRFEAMWFNLDSSTYRPDAGFSIGSTYVTLPNDEFSRVCTSYGTDGVVCNFLLPRDQYPNLTNGKNIIAYSWNPDSPADEVCQTPQFLITGNATATDNWIANGAMCGNNVCNTGENFQGCPSDCQDNNTDQENPSTTEDGNFPPIDSGLTTDTLNAVNPLKLFGNEAETGDLSTPGGFFTRVLSFAFPIAGLLLFVMLTWGGFEYLQGATNKKYLDAGKNRITAAIIGFILLFVSFWIMRIIGLIFGATFF